jgi:hypothetical protein
VKDRGPGCLSLVPDSALLVNAFAIVRSIVAGVFSIAKFIILSLLRVGRWCWDRIRLR